MKEIYWGDSIIKHGAEGATGGLVQRDGEAFYKITSYDQMLPFFMAVSSGSDHWMFVSSTGGLTCGRRSPENALFPYNTDDKIHDACSTTGPQTVLLVQKDDKTYVVNFWATWCKPCIDELPAFEKLFKNYKNQQVELILVSLDFPNQIEKRVIPFIEKNNLKGKVVLMADPDQNIWIPKVSKEWSGAIPATVIYNKNTRKFYEQSFTYKELETALNEILNLN